MKNFIKHLWVLAFMLISSVTLFAQGVGEIPVPLENYAEAFATFAALVGVIPIVTEFLKRILGANSTTPNALIQTLSWVVGIVLTMFGWWFQLGFLQGIEWYSALLWGFGASLAANGVADTKIIQWIFSLFVKK